MTKEYEVVINNFNTGLFLSDEIMKEFGIENEDSEQRHSLKLINLVKKHGKLRHPNENEYAIEDRLGLEVVSIKGNRYKIIQHYSCGVCFDPFEEVVTPEDDNWIVIDDENI